ncbi:MAG TPA: 30S ribosomal protein THX [Rhodanobacteraceae bacterium]|nr:30S ribosomal protein THX [Rhodanobacteraceae bacterium]
MPAAAHPRGSRRKPAGADMGKGDKKSRKGKIYRGSHGNVRPHSPKSNSAVKGTATRTPAAPRAPAKKAPARKTAAKKAAPKKSA